MDWTRVELLTPVHIRDMYREAEVARLAAAIPRRPMIAVLPLPALGRALVRAGHWLEQLDPPCPDCPAPVRS